MESSLLFGILIVLYIILNVLDGYTTYKVISRTSYHNERNPIARFIFKKIGVIGGVIAIKSLMIPIIALMIYYYSFKNYTMNLILVFADVLYSYAVINNFNVYKRVKLHEEIRLSFQLDSDDDEEDDD
jgi:hypothetical protein